MGDLERDTRLVGEKGRYTATLSRDWEIWGPNGGYLAAIALRAAGAEAAIQRPASFTGHFFVGVRPLLGQPITALGMDLGCGCGGFGSIDRVVRFGRRLGVNGDGGCFGGLDQRGQRCLERRC